MLCAPVACAIFGQVAAKRSISETTIEVTVAKELTHVTRQAPESQAYLVVIAGARLGQHILLGEREIDVGRGPSCAMQLDADSVSRRHARVLWDGRRHVVQDLQSTNGTFVDEHRVTECAMRDGDRLQVGHVLLKYLSGSNVELAYHEEIQRLMSFDGLTGVANRSRFEEELSNALWRTRTRPAPVSLAVMDVDHFKNVNDTYGHAAGDAVLRQTAEIACRQVVGDQVFARVGGEEFAVLIAGQPIAVAVDVAERIRRSVEAHRMGFDGRVIPVTVSLGVAERQAGSVESGERLFERADTQLYAAKAAGRNCVR